jgi:hypothetical protein
VISKLLLAVDGRVGCLRPRHITRVFLASDLLCFAIQAGCAGLITSDDLNSQKKGYNVILLGLLLQFVVFVSFAIVAVLTWRKPEFRGPDLPAAVVRVFQLCLFTIVVLLARNVWRVYDYGLGLHNFTARQSHRSRGRNGRRTRSTLRPSGSSTRRSPSSTSGGCCRRRRSCPRSCGRPFPQRRRPRRESRRQRLLWRRRRRQKRAL